MLIHKCCYSKKKKFKITSSCSYASNIRIIFNKKMKKGTKEELVKLILFQVRRLTLILKSL